MKGAISKVNDETDKWLKQQMEWQDQMKKIAGIDDSFMEWAKRQNEWNEKITRMVLGPTTDWIKQQNEWRKAIKSVGIDKSVLEGVTKISQIIQPIKLPQNLLKIDKTTLENITRISQMIQPIKLPDNLLKLDKTVIETMQSVTKMFDSSKLTNTALNSNLDLFKTSTLKAITDTQVNLLKYLQTKLPEDLEEDKQEEMDGFVTKEQLGEVIAEFQQQIMQLNNVSDIKWVIQYVIYPMISFIIAVMTIVVHYAEVHDNVQEIISDVNHIVQEHQVNSNDAPAIKFKQNQEVSGGEKG